MVVSKIHSTGLRNYFPNINVTSFLFLKVAPTNFVTLSVVIRYFYWTVLTRESLHQLASQSWHPSLPCMEVRFSNISWNFSFWPQWGIPTQFPLLATANKVRVYSTQRKVYLYSFSANYCFVLLTFFCSLVFGSLICAFHSLGVAKVAHCTTQCGWLGTITAHSFIFHHSKTKTL